MCGDIGITMITFPPQPSSMFGPPSGHSYPGIDIPTEAEMRDILDAIRAAFPPEQKDDPYAELKAALAAGKTIQMRNWEDVATAMWCRPPDCYRVKPEPAAEPQAQPEEPATTNQKPQQEQGVIFLSTEDNISYFLDVPPILSAQSDADGGIEWNGGECPVSGDTIVQVTLRSGIIRVTKAAHLIWQHGGPFEEFEDRQGDIVRYRVVRDDKPPATCKTPATPAEACASDSETGQHAPGVKLDKGKPRAGLVLGGFSRALLAVADVGTFGAQKYTPHGWLSVPHGIERYTDAMVRHQLAEASGEQTDSESGLSHAAHAAWNALARLELLLAEAKAREAAKRA